ncbi:MAG: hypothetical protein CGU28_04575 [Candidatus Dactylopiibacterium carminicum]|uniref:Uncharacterized protein n=1 Tax=Candidatus Dactylopiibacterium carminicum TaxID=857335 RepID=A0A272EWX8_9RHOO|nr:hypothetical protein BGI27_04530 [Candidatus Dactylopiibacterium carminicum]PAS94609.1 MAG: hypothetical protein CGU29_03465 [Candidatus Dactylopiibacterium carminicum]PAS97648.1 MAG: hypothetical protein CGU28_04575 [Candidatus Dactylopiibacterium carminicum]
MAIDGKTWRPATDSERQLVTLLYLLHAIGLAIGAFSQAVTMVGAFVFGWTSIVAIIINYIKREDLRDTILASHLQWQSDTFWRSLLAMIIAFALYFVLLGFLINWLLYGLIGLWATWRIVKGWLVLRDGRPVGEGPHP